MHKWLAMIVGLQLLLWFASGAFAKGAGAVEMSRIAVRESRDAGVRRMAQLTITKQQKEINELNAMLRAKGESAIVRMAGTRASRLH